jgi:hypothetical protein
VEAKELMNGLQVTLQNFLALSNVEQNAVESSLPESIGTQELVVAFLVSDFKVQILLLQLSVFTVQLQEKTQE